MKMGLPELIFAGFILFVGFFVYKNLKQDLAEQEPEEQEFVVTQEMWNKLHRKMTEFRDNAQEESRTVTNRFNRHDEQINKLKEDLRELEKDTDLGQFIAEFRRELARLDKEIASNQNRRLNYQMKMRKYLVKELAKRPIPIKVTNRPTKKFVKSTHKYTKGKDGSYTRESDYEISYKKKTTRKKCGVEKLGPKAKDCQKPVRKKKARRARGLETLVANP